MKKIVAIITILIVCITLPNTIYAAKELPFDGNSWVNISIADVAKILDDAGYTKNEDRENNEDVLLYTRNNCPETVSVIFDTHSFMTTCVNLIFYYDGSEIVKRLVESYSILYGEPNITKNDYNNDVYVWKDNENVYEVTFCDTYEDAKQGMPFTLSIRLSDNNEPDSNVKESKTTPEPEKTPAKTIEPGQAIDLPFITIEYTGSQVLEKLRFTAKETGGMEQSLYKDQEDSKYITIRGELKNKSKKALDVSNGLRGIAYVDGYEYSLHVFTTGGFEVEPLVNYYYYIYALVPNIIANNFEKCEFVFGFNEDFESDYFEFDEATQYDYKYQAIIKKQTKQL